MHVSDNAFVKHQLGLAVKLFSAHFTFVGHFFTLNINIREPCHIFYHRRAMLCTSCFTFSSALSNGDTVNKAIKSVIFPISTTIGGRIGPRILVGEGMVVKQVFARARPIPSPLTVLYVVPCIYRHVQIIG